MFNFLDPKLLPKVKCNVPSSDNYEIENLINENYSLRTRGFIAYPSIKPPVELEFEFICPVAIDSIIINTTVGNQKCSGIEVFCKQNNNYNSVAKAIYSKNGVCFCNARKFSKSYPPPQHVENYELAFFKGAEFRSFLNARSVKILIFKTEKSVPCIANIQIWGSISKSCSDVTKQTVLKLMTREVKDTCVKSEETFSIPDDFKDNLTYEVMAMPMTLPSGNTIDQKTLEKHLEVEKEFGRPPCDPFTGKKFTNSCKPIFNAALKSRIDMFLLQNAHRKEIFDLKQTTGGFSIGSSNDPYAKGKKRLLTQEHKDDNCDLDQEIKKVKSSPNFILFSECNKMACTNCSTQNNLYSLPCNHLYCRLCLMDVCKALKCKICSKNFVKNDVEKVHK